MPTLNRTFTASLLALLLIPLAACKARKDYPEPHIGWHNPSFTAVFGTLQKVPGRTPDAPPTWTIRFGTPQDVHQGQLALTPPQKLTGYSGGEPVELKGHMLDQETGDAFNGRWYVIDSIQLWSTYKQ